MSKEIKDYLPLYVGCYCKVNEFDDEILLLTGVTYSSITNIYGAYFESVENGYYSLASEVKPILRKLSSMTEEEETEINGEWGNPCSNGLTDALKDGTMHYVKEIGQAFELTYYLLSKGFDLFNLIDENLAIDKETLNK